MVALAQGRKHVFFMHEGESEYAIFKKITCNN